MKPRCQELEPLLASYVDEEAAPPDRAAVEAHLNACAPCRDRLVGERAARDVLRARGAGLRPCASNALRTRCAAHRLAPASRGGVLTRRAWVPLSLAAALLLALSGTLFFAGNSVEVLAAQLAVDHMKCFQFAPDRSRAAIDPVAEAKRWEAGYGWPIKVPPSADAQQLELIEVRRCLSSEGRVAHLMYRWHGQPLSVFVLNSGVRDRSDPHAAEIVASTEKLGEQTIIWSRGDRTFAIVASAPASELQQVAQYVRQVSE
jgi:anti-sigma factor RsiW